MCWKKGTEGMRRFFEFANSRFDMIKDLSNMKFYVLLSAIIVSTLLLIMFPGMVSFIVFLVSVFIMFCYWPFIPLIFWIILLPFENHLRQQAMISPYYALVLLISIYVFVSIFFRKERINWLSALFSIVMIIISTLSLFTMGITLVSIGKIVSLSTVLIVFYALTLFMKQTDKSIFLITIALFVSAALAMFFSVMTTSGYRFSLFDNVRSIANVLGIAIVLGVMYLYKRFTTSDSDEKFKLSSYQGIGLIVYLVVMSIFLLLTVSRGVILAEGISLLIFFSIIIKPNFSKKIIKRMLIFTLLFVFITYVVSLTPLSNLLGWDRIIYRFSDNFLENVRFQFWFYALEKLSQNHLFFGIGLANFENFIVDGGYVFYSHSVFVDLIVSTGLVGVISIALLSLKLLFNIIKERNLLSWTILIYTLVSFSTHGTVFSKFFWLSMALIIGVLDYNKIRFYKRRGKKIL
jgi:O-antigen ligase